MRPASQIRAAVNDIGSQADLDKALETAGSKLVIIDYSTTWCGPCKVIAPRFEEFSDRYADSVFLKVMGDSSAEAGKLMSSQGIRQVPAFHFWKDKAKVEEIRGAKADALEAAIKRLQ